MMTARGSSGCRAGGAVAAAVLCIVSVVLLGRLDGVAAECIHSFEEEGVGFDMYVQPFATSRILSGFP